MQTSLIEMKARSSCLVSPQSFEHRIDPELTDLPIFVDTAGREKLRFNYLSVQE